MPIGLGIYFAWVNRDWSARTKATGFAAAAGGALVGGVARVQRRRRTSLALLTTIAGAAVGANLALLLLDIAWDRQVRDRFGTADATETLEARPSIG